MDKCNLCIFNICILGLIWSWKFEKVEFNLLILHCYMHDVRCVCQNYVQPKFCGFGSQTAVYGSNDQLSELV